MVAVADASNSGNADGRRCRRCCRFAVDSGPCLWCLTMTLFVLRGPFWQMRRASASLPISFAQAACMAKLRRQAVFCC